MNKNALVFRFNSVVEFATVLKDIVQGMLPCGLCAFYGQRLGNNNTMRTIISIMEDEEDLQPGVKKGARLLFIPCLYVDALYNEYNSGIVALDELIALGKRCVSLLTLNGAFGGLTDIDRADDCLYYYELFKDKIYCKLVNYEKNMEYLEDKLYVRIGEFAVIFYVLLDIGEENCSYHGVLPGNFAKLVNLCNEDIFKLAKINTVRDFPIVDMGFPFGPTPTGAYLNVYSSTDMQCGSIHMFNKSFLASIAAENGADLFIVPADTDMFFIADSRVVSYADCAYILHEITSMDENMGVFLSNNVYRYNSATNEIVLCGEEKVIF